MRVSVVAAGLMAAAALLSPVDARAQKMSVASTQIEGIDQPQAPSSLRMPFASLSYAPFGRSERPGQDRPSLAQIRTDLELLRPYTRTIRTYSSINGLEKIVPIAEELGIDVMVGIWINENDAYNEQDIEGALALARRHRNVSAIFVGNETTLYAAHPPTVVRRLIRIIERVRAESPVPVTTGEFWHIWRDHPELVAATDFIAAHILPYWENVAAGDAVDFTLGIYRQLQNAYPGTRVLIGEFGWPSEGYQGKLSGPAGQAQVLRDFALRSHAENVEYNLIEAIDQPWKTHEGPVGPHWGIFDADRLPKPVVDGLIY